MMISSSIMIEKQAMKIEKYSHKKSRFCLIQKKLDKGKNQLRSVLPCTYGDKDGDKLYAAGDPHAEIDAVNENVLDLLPGEVAHPPFLNSPFQLSG